MSATQREAIVAALKARGEVHVEDSALSKFQKWTRTFKVTRSPDGLLQQIDPVQRPSFYYLGRKGSLRAGKTSTTSHSLHGKMRYALIDEGMRHLKGGGK